MVKTHMLLLSYRQNDSLCRVGRHWHKHRAAHPGVVKSFDQLRATEFIRQVELPDLEEKYCATMGIVGHVYKID